LKPLAWAMIKSKWNLDIFHFDLIIAHANGFNIYILVETTLHRAYIKSKNWWYKYKDVATCKKYRFGEEHNHKKMWHS
jgi:hypothetical protein